MNHNKKDINVAIIKENFLHVSTRLLQSNLSLEDIQNVSLKKYSKRSFNITYLICAVVVVLICVLYQYSILDILINYALGVRCFVPNNYFVWEATRPVSDCQFCLNVTAPIILPNITRDEFRIYAYTSKPIVVKKAFLHWPAMTKFSYNFFKELYNRIEDAYKSVDEECQFLHFKSNFISLRDVFTMSENRVNNKQGEKSWYVGWGNCHPEVLDEMHKYYSKPHFLPDDCEIPSKEYVFMGYDAGATTHLDFIPRLMWQAQLKGSKTWHLIPSPECEQVCQSQSFSVEPGDAVLVDTRVWYHGTTITPGEFSLSIQSEYG